MNAEVISGFFTHQHNQSEVVRQEYEAAKDHFREVCQHRIAGNADHDRRFRDAIDRRNAARERFVELLTK
ncbi:hypothetical protein [Fimbriiglobus ruber]|uniref:hypothetical protein n=1 Tax=Fimbriiglobus ruber TaxID=1908690 RepID=UPI000B4B3E1E|nr:hypothetical protein [Fimbriiglobus ruber]